MARRIIPTLLLIAAAVGGLQMYGCHQREIGRRDATIKARDVAIDSLRGRTARTDTIYRLRVDTLRIVRTRTNVQLDTILQRTTDTIVQVHRDTLVQIVERERLACDAVVASCEQRVATRDSLLQLQALQIKDLRKPDKLFGFLPAPSKEIVFGAGVVAGALLTRR
jgi:hypothetical protein